MQFIKWCHVSVLDFFYFYGTKLGEYPYCFIIGCLVVSGLLATGLYDLNPENSIEELYTSEDSPSRENRDEYKRYFGPEDDDYSEYGWVVPPPQVMVIVRSTGGQNILEDRILNDVVSFLDRIKSLKVTGYNYTTRTMDTYKYNELCVRTRGKCFSDQYVIFSPLFRKLLDEGNITYPTSEFFPLDDLSALIGQAKTSDKDNILLSAQSLYIRLPIRTNIYRGQDKWLKLVLDTMKNILPKLTGKGKNIEIAYSTSYSLDEEVSTSMQGDVVFFIMTFLLMVSYAIMVSSGGDMVSTRALLSISGVMATCLGIFAAIGLVTMLGVRYVSTVGVMPFLLLGVSVDDMFLLMTAWSETTAHGLGLPVPERVGKVFLKAGVGITITSLTNFMTFTIGATSSFKSVRNFCMYTGTGVLLCYLTNVTFFGGCLALHGKRIKGNRHVLTCARVKNEDEASTDGHGFVYKTFCSGNIPIKTIDDQSICEMWPSIVITRFALWKPVRILALILFPLNLCVAIWGCTLMTEGLHLEDLLLEGSYAHTFQSWARSDYGGRVPITFTTTGPTNYTDPNTLFEMKKLLAKAQADEDISSRNAVCWLTLYAQMPFYDASSDKAFHQGLDMFLKQFPMFRKDFGMAKNGQNASRCHVFSNRIDEMHGEARLMVRMVELADESPVVDFAYNHGFIFYEQFISITPMTIQTVGSTIIVMCLVTAVFLPHPMIVLIVVVQVMMVMTCIFGYMALIGLSLSSITMTHLIMSVGLSVDFCAHVCTAYMVSEKGTRQERARDAIVHASGPILNGGTSSMVGIMGLILSKSFIFQSFLIIMSLVIGFGVAHAVFFVPALLSHIGPRNYVQKYSREDSTTKRQESTKNVSARWNASTHDGNDADAFGGKGWLETAV